MQKLINIIYNAGKIILKYREIKDFILTEAGCSLVDVETKRAPVYSNLRFKKNYFVAARQNINLDNLQYPKFL